MASPLTDRSLAPHARPALAAAPLPDAVLDAVAEIAGAAGAWCPALSPDGTRVAYVTDRSGIPRLEVAGLDPDSVPAVLSAPAQEVVSVAWSPDGAWLAYLVSPGGSICAELHAVRPDGTDARLLAGEDPRATVFAGGWTGAWTPTSSWSTSEPGSSARSRAAGSCRSRRCPPTSASSWPAGAPAATGTSS
jgi:dipeptidyl aminopeptidase/acylaminoacyl peptidase